MPFLKILVPVTGGSRDGYALATAFTAARKFDAHVVALFVHADPHDTLPFGELPLSPDFVQELIDVASDVEQTASKAARSTLAISAAESGVRLINQPEARPGLSASYQEATGYLPHVLGRMARLYDLVVFPPLYGSGGAHDMPDSFARVLLKTSCPVLLSAQMKPERLGRQVTVGWDNGIACARAVVTAVPFLQDVEMVDIVSVRDKMPEDTGFEDAIAYLALHGVPATARNVTPEGRKIAEALMQEANKFGSDMLVIGGYSRGRMTEAMFGGITEYIVSNPALPVFMVH